MGIREAVITLPEIGDLAEVNGIRQGVPGESVETVIVRAGGEIFHVSASAINDASTKAWGQVARPRGQGKPQTGGEWREYLGETPLP